MNLRKEFGNMNHKERGGILLQVLGLTALISMAAYFLFTQAHEQKKVVLQTDSVLNVRFALHSVLDYTFFGLRQRYCFDDYLMQDPNCTLQHPASSERVLMSQEQEGFIREMIAGGVSVGPVDPAAIRLKSFKKKLSLSQVSPMHPLFAMLQRLGKVLPKSELRVEVARDESSQLPKAGREVYFQVKATLVDGAGRTLVSGRTPLEMTSYATIYPRELGTFALVVPGSLRLDETYGRPLPRGDLGIPLLRSSSSVPGLVFQSPVFVNQNIHLPYQKPQDGGRYDRTHTYSPVTFSDRVYIGNGAVLEGGESVYVPNTAGGAKDRLWSDNKLFGGFLAGIAVDGSLDKGLHVLGRVGGGLPPDANLMAVCIARTRAQSDRATLLRSEVYANLSASDASGGWTYRIGVTDGNKFSPQEGNFRTVEREKIAADQVAQSGPVRGAVSNVRLHLGDRWVAFDLAAGSKYSVSPPVASSAYEEGLVRNVTLAERATPRNQAQIDLAKQRLKDFQDKKAAPPVVSVELRAVEIGAAGPQPHLVDLKLDIKNAPSLLDPSGTPYAPKLEVQVYDPSFRRYRSFMGDGARLFGHIDFSLASDGSLQAPAGLRARSSQPVKDIAEDKTDYFTIDKNCERARGAASTQAFGGAAWSFDFSPQSRNSWNFAGTSSTVPGTDPAIDEVIFDENNARPELGNVTFRVHAIAGQCTVRSGARLVTGFLVCDRLVIEPRSTPLQIIGSIIAGELDIDPSAYANGMVWSTIYHPQATAILRNAGVLRSKSGADCTSLSGSPIWHPVPSVVEAADRISCNAVSLRAKANPFQWTTVDPDCGIIPGGSNTSCKRRPLKFYILEHGRSGGV